MGFEFMPIDLKLKRYDYEEWYKKRPNDEEEQHQIPVMPPLEGYKKVSPMPQLKGHKKLYQPCLH